MSLIKVISQGFKLADGVGASSNLSLHSSTFSVKLIRMLTNYVPLVPLRRKGLARVSRQAGMHLIFFFFLKYEAAANFKNYLNKFATIPMKRLAK